MIRLVQWRWLSIVLLGTTANFVINWIFDFRRPIETFQWTEYLIAIGLSAILLEGIRFANRTMSDRLDSRKFRIPVVILIDLLIVVLLIDGVGTAYMILLYEETYSGQEYLVINMVTLALIAIVSLIDQLLKKKIEDPDSGDSVPALIPVSYAGGKKWIKPEEIRFCYLEQTLPYVICGADRFVSEQNLSELSALLPGRFFRLNRQFILDRLMIDRTKSADYGKIEVYTVDQPFLPKKLVVSRKRASEFRRWLKEYSASRKNL